MLLTLAHGAIKARSFDRARGGRRRLVRAPPPRAQTRCHDLEVVRGDRTGRSRGPPGYATSGARRTMARAPTRPGPGLVSSSTVARAQRRARAVDVASVPREVEGGVGDPGVAPVDDTGQPAARGAQDVLGHEVTVAQRLLTDDADPLKKRSSAPVPGAGRAAAGRRPGSAHELVRPVVVVVCRRRAPRVGHEGGCVACEGREEGREDVYRRRRSALRGRRPRPDDEGCRTRQRAHGSSTAAGTSSGSPGSAIAGSRSRLARAAAVSTSGRRAARGRPSAAPTSVVDAVPPLAQRDRSGVPPAHDRRPTRAALSGTTLAGSWSRRRTSSSTGPSRPRKPPRAASGSARPRSW